MNAHEFVSLWDEGEGDTFKADPPNAVLTWVDGDEMKEAELLILKCRNCSHGREIAYEVKLEAGDTPAGNIGAASFFVDDTLKCMLAGGWAFPRGCRACQYTLQVSTAHGKTKRPHPPTTVLLT